MKKISPPHFKLLASVAVASLAWLHAAGPLSAQETNPSAAAPIRAEAGQTQDLLRAYLQVQEQLHATQLALERNRQDAEDMAARNTLALADRLNSIELSLGEQRAANRSILMVAGGIAGLGILAMIIASFMQMRAMNRFTEAALGLSTQSFALGHGPDPRLLGNSASGEAGARLRGTIARLEQRIRELETAAPAAPALTVVGGGAENGEAAGRLETLVGKGQALLSSGRAAEAAAALDEALALNPQHTEALVKKGAALEKLEKFDEAVACYDRAIAADSTVTIAYLYKAGILNRLERQTEALACYEQALKLQEKERAA